MKKIIAILAIVGLLTCVQTVSAQEQTKDTTEIVENDTITADSAMAVIDADLQGMEAELEGEGAYSILNNLRNGCAYICTRYCEWIYY